MLVPLLAFCGQVGGEKTVAVWVGVGTYWDRGGLCGLFSANRSLGSQKAQLPPYVRDTQTPQRKETLTTSLTPRSFAARHHFLKASEQRPGSPVGGDLRTDTGWWLEVLVPAPGHSDSLA